MNNIITFIIISLLLHSSIRQRSLGKHLPQQVSNCSRLLTYILKHYVVQLGTIPKYTIVIVSYPSLFFAPERRCSSRTFRYGYLVTT